MLYELAELVNIKTMNLTICFNNQTFIEQGANVWPREDKKFKWWPLPSGSSQSRVAEDTSAVTCNAKSRSYTGSLLSVMGAGNHDYLAEKHN